jgi:hypothetical protein
MFLSTEQTLPPSHWDWKAGMMSNVPVMLWQRSGAIMICNDQRREKNDFVQYNVIAELQTLLQES